MNNFHDYYFGLSNTQRDTLAKNVGTTIYNLEGIAGGFKVPSLPMATRIVRAAGKKVTYDMIVATCEKRRGPF